MDEFSKYTKATPTESAVIDKVNKAAEEIMLATIMVKNCNQKLYNNIDENLRMDFAKGMDNKPLTVTDAQETLNQFWKAKNQHQPRNPNPNPNPNPNHRNKTTNTNNSNNIKNLSIPKLTCPKKQRLAQPTPTPPHQSN